MTDTRIQADAEGAILFDAEVAPQVGHAWFDPGTWEREGRLRGRGGGRGAACFVDTPAGACVLRHYHRGGMIAPLLGDRYLWRGRDQTRSFAEFRLLQTLHGRGLPVPVAVAARYRRRGVHYTADLLTRAVEDARTLAECLRDGTLDAALAHRLGALVARFHAEGVWHADLNAHNVLLADGSLYLIDFDRGELRTPAPRWQHENLARLRRSLLKLGAEQRAGDFERRLWQPLMQGYEASRLPGGGA